MNKKIPYSLLILLMTLNISSLKAADTNDNILIQDASFSISKQEALIMLEDMTSLQRKRMLSDIDKFKDLLIDLLIVKKKAEEAKKLNIDKQKLVQWKIEKAKMRILSNQLINQYRNKITTPDNIDLLAKEYYDTHPEEFLIEEKVKVAHILLSTRKVANADAKAKKFKSLKKIITQIKKGEITFEEAAKKYSDDTGSARSGGIINYFTRGKMVKPFEEAAFNLRNKNDLSDIVETQFGYHIIKLIDHIKKSTQPYSEVKDNLIKMETKKYIKSKVKAYSDTFRVNKDTIIYQKAIQNIISNAK
jgi:parvulin-like peptidyl-prolyl isomerase